MPIMRGGCEVFSLDWNDSFSGVLECTKYTGNGPERGGSGVEEVAQGSSTERWVPRGQSGSVTCLCFAGTAPSEGISLTAWHKQSPELVFVDK